MLNGIFRFFERIIIKFIREKNAAVLPMAAILFPVIIGMVGVGIDFSSWMHDRRALQNASDAAAIAAAYEVLYGDPDNMEAAALKEAMNNGYVNDTDAGASIDVAYVPGADGGPIGSTIEVILRRPTNQYFSSMLMDGQPFVNTVSGVNINRPNEFCMLSLNESADKAIYIAGDASISAPGCSMAANSDSNKALVLQGSYDVEVGEVNVAGDVTEIGNSGSFENDGVDTGTDPLPDPYADLEPPEIDYPADCEAIQNDNGYISHTSGGTSTILCSDIIESSSALEFEAGTYYLYGADIRFNGTTFLADDVTFVLTGDDSVGYGQLTVVGSGSVTLNAPTDESADYPGISIFQDRNAPYSTNDPNKLSGNSEIVLNGVAYFPNQHLYFGGSNQTQVPSCSMVIASTIEIHGTPNMDTSCDGIPVEFIDPPNVILSY
jgi:hypothetical protein